MIINDKQQSLLGFFIEFAKSEKLQLEQLNQTKSPYHVIWFS
jgi:hypothetical protein